jgi:hypothetical protein
MIIIILMTMMVVTIPVLYMINTRYIQRIAFFIGASQIALLAFSGKIDNQLAEVLINGINRIAMCSFNLIIQKVSLLFYSF